MITHIPQPDSLSAHPASVRPDSAPPENVHPYVEKLCRRLAEESISYCHWKSNWRLSRWAAADGDLDLLVAREHVVRFTAVLHELGFKAATPPRDRQLPGIQDYYAYDPLLDRFIHVHAHYQLVLGHDYTKSYHLSLERLLLTSAWMDGLLPRPSIEVEYILFVLRMTLKWSLTETLCGKPVVSSQSMREELAYLHARIDPARIPSLLAEHLPSVSLELLDECRHMLETSCSIRQQWETRSRLHRALRSQCRRSRTEDAVLKMIHRCSLLVDRAVYRRTRKKRLAAGGALIALVGGDGAGKTTCVDEVRRWLSRKFETHRVHIGRPPRSLLTHLVVCLYRVERRLPGRQNPRHASPLQLARWACLAADRERLYRRIRARATNGDLVICDRFPLSQLRQMDGPKIARALEGTPTNAYERALIAFEHRCYRGILTPDLLVVLRLEPGVAVARKTDEPAETVYLRSRELWETDWSGTDARVVDTGRPLPEVLQEIKSIIWNSL